MLTGHELRFHLFGGPVMDPVVSLLQEAITVTPIDIVHQRRIAAVTHAVDGGNVSETSRVFGVSRKTIYQWKKTAETYGMEGLRPKDRRRPRCRTPPRRGLSTSCCSWRSWSRPGGPLLRRPAR